jgi:hypothetical protein
MLWAAAYALLMPLLLGWLALSEELRHVNDIAAWVQAVGSVAAIIVAVVVARQSAADATNTQKAEVVRKVELVCSLGWQVHHYAAEVAQNILTNIREMPTQANLDLIVALIDRYPIEQSPSAELALRLANIRRIALAFGEMQGEALHWRAKHFTGNYGNRLARLNDLERELVDEYEQLLACGQRLLDAQPGSRILLPSGSARN